MTAKVTKWLSGSFGLRKKKGKTFECCSAITTDQLTIVSVHLARAHLSAFDKWPGPFSTQHEHQNFKANGVYGS